MSIRWVTTGFLSWETSYKKCRFRMSYSHSIKSYTIEARNESGWVHVANCPLRKLVNEELQHWIGEKL
jgi:hypothetical protein